jgi:hypothetical protein
MCGIAIEDDKKRNREMEGNHDDREVMDVLKLVLDGECADDDVLPMLLKMNRGKLVKGILNLFPQLLLVMQKLISVREKLKNTSLNTPMLVILCLVIIIK